MLEISREALQDGCDRARDLFLLGRLQEPLLAADTFTAVFDALGVDHEKRAHLREAVAELVPVEGVPMLEATPAASMMNGVLVGVLIADSAVPGDELDLPVTSP